jgi:hypothetical protein
MAKKKTKRQPTPATGKRRKRRSPDQIIADLEAEIRRVKERAVAKQMKESPAVKASMTAIRALDKGLEAASEENNSRLRHALADARKALGSYLEGAGLRLPKAQLPKGPRPRS